MTIDKPRLALCFGRATAVVLAIAAIVAIAAPKSTAAPGGHIASPRRGELVSVTAVQRLTPAGVRRAIAESEINAAQVRVGVDAYRLVYRTVSPTGQLTTASGLVALPRTPATSLRPIVFEHGTNVPKRLAPSTGAESDGRLIALLDASSGFAAVAPDYVGLGVGPGGPAYLDVRSEVSASIDLLRAARTFAATKGRQLESSILVSGFSQGGPAAMGLGHALQAGADPGSTLGGLTAAGGVYDLQHAELPAIVAGRLSPPITNYNLTLFALSWRRLYHVFGGTTQVFQPGTARIVRLFDGHYSDARVFAALPNSLTALFTPAFLHELAHPRGALLRALRANDMTCQWQPEPPVALFTSVNDEAVTPVNTAHCAAQLRAHGATARVISLGRTEHLASSAVAAPLMLRWLARQPSDDTTPSR